MSTITLFCLPCAGASASMYFPWSDGLAEVADLRALELPGRGRRIREPLLQGYAALVEMLACELATALAAIDGPYVIFGHSMGALLAHGIAQRLRTQSVRLPSALLVSACAAPSAREWSLADDSDAALIASLRRQGGTREEVFECPELLEMTLPVLRADYRVCTSFQQTRAQQLQEDLLSLPVHVFGGLEDAVPPSGLRAWQHETAGPFTLDWFSGGHFYLQPQQHALLARIGDYLRLYRDKQSGDLNALSNASIVTAMSQ
jgi:surfactin synthase thioesterase subunit